MPLASQVILFVIDGLCPDGLHQAHTPEIDRLLIQGAHTWQAQAVTPSITLPCHVSMFYAVSPSRHGIVSNVWTTPSPPVPGLIDVAHQAGLDTAPPLAYLLGLPAPVEWSGRVVAEVLTS